MWTEETKNDKATSLVNHADTLAIYVRSEVNSLIESGLFSLLK